MHAWRPETKAHLTWRGIYSQAWGMKTIVKHGTELINTFVAQGRKCCPSLQFERICSYWCLHQNIGKWYMYFKTAKQAGQITIVIHSTGQKSENVYGIADTRNWTTIIVWNNVNIQDIVQCSFTLLRAFEIRQTWFAVYQWSSQNTQPFKRGFLLYIPNKCCLLCFCCVQRDNLLEAG